jgi:tetratricopeptide (TPR) repeat protein
LPPLYLESRIFASIFWMQGFVLFRQMGAYLLGVDKLECLISKAEIAYKSGRVAQARKWAERALEQCTVPSKSIALRIFIARCYSKLGKFAESNKIYRELLVEKIYIAPVVFGLFYNNFAPGNVDKMNLNLVLVKSCLLLP